jgi:hypothetical protein
MTNIKRKLLAGTVTIGIPITTAENFDALGGFHGH